MTSDDQAKYELPLQGASHPSTQRSGTNPGSFAQKAQIGAALTFSSPDTPGMPARVGRRRPGTSTPSRALSKTA
jgi:hypothetical protein